jgi:hypothetical protein
MLNNVFDAGHTATLDATVHLENAKRFTKEFLFETLYGSVSIISRKSGHIRKCSRSL